MFNATGTLRELGPKYGPSFDNHKKNFLYVSRIFASELRNITKTIDDRRITIIYDESTGAFSRAAEDIADAEETAPAKHPPCLISVVGVERFLGAPPRVISKDSKASDIEWLRARVAGVTVKAVRIFAHLGLDSADSTGSQLVDDHNK